jgi:histidinol-phosphate aminotransferase
MRAAAGLSHKIALSWCRNAREFITTMPTLGVAPGRPFPPLDNMLRVSIGTDADMAKFREVFWKVYKG